MRSAMLYGLRRAHGISQGDMAARLGISRPTYIRKEENVENFTLKDIEIIKKTFNKTYEEIFKEII